MNRLVTRLRHRTSWVRPARRSSRLVVACDCRCGSGSGARASRRPSSATARSCSPSCATSSSTAGSGATTPSASPSARTPRSSPSSTSSTCSASRRSGLFSVGRGHDGRHALLPPRVPARRRHDLPPRPQRAARPARIGRRRVLFAAAPYHAERFEHLWLASYWTLPLGLWVVSRWRAAARPWTSTGARDRRRRRRCSRCSPSRSSGLSGAYYAGFTLILLAAAPCCGRARARPPGGGGRAGRPWLWTAASSPRSPSRRQDRDVGHRPHRPPARDAHAPGVGALCRAPHRPRPAVGGPPARAARRPDAGLPCRRAPGHRDPGPRHRRGGRAASPSCSSACACSTTARPAPERLRLWAALLARRRRLLHGRGPGQRRRAPRHAPAAHLVALLARHPAVRAARGRPLAEPPSSRVAWGLVWQPSSSSSAFSTRPTRTRAPDYGAHRERGSTALSEYTRHWRHATAPGCGVLQLPVMSFPEGYVPLGLRRERPAGAAPHVASTELEPRGHARDPGGRLGLRHRSRGP